MNNQFRKIFTEVLNEITKFFFSSVITDSKSRASVLFGIVFDIRILSV
jgi:hypothetical protein